MWVIWPRVGTAVPIVYTFDGIGLPSADPNWYMTYEIRGA